MKLEDVEKEMANNLRKNRTEKSQKPLPPDSPLHGTLGGYNNHGCRCERCTAANTEHQRRYREDQRAVDASGEGGNQPVGKVQARTAR